MYISIGILNLTINVIFDKYNRVHWLPHFETTVIDDLTVYDFYFTVIHVEYYSYKE